jgi:hypothetical protein
MCINDCSDGDGSLHAMHPQVSRQAALLAGAVITVRTVEGLLPSVQPQVCRQVALLAGAVIAVRTVGALLPSVHQQVLLQVALVAGAVIAVCTVEALLPSVHEQVPRQVALVAGAVIAVRTVEALLPSVHEQVRRQVALLAGTVIAVRTVEALLPSVHEQVSRQAALSAGAVIAVLALVGLLPSVHEQVLREVALAGGFVIAVLANVLHHHLAACATATGSIKQSRADRQHGCSHEETEPTGLTEPTERVRCPAARVEDRKVPHKKMRRPPNVHSVAHGRLPTCTVTAAAPLWNLAAVAMQLLDVMLVTLNDAFAVMLKTLTLPCRRMSGQRRHQEQKSSMHA